MKIFFQSFILSIFFIPVFANGATLFLDPQNKDVKVGDTFSVSVNTNSQGTSINAASLDIKYDPKLLSVSSVGKNSSIFSLWAEEPTYSNVRGTIHFSGGLSSPGWNGGSGNIIKISFKAKTVGQAKIALSNGSVLANDGIGTDVLSAVQGSDINIVKASQVIEPEKATSTKGTQVISEGSLIPFIENLPESLNEGEILAFNGTGISNGQIQVYIQKGKKDAEITQINTKQDGKFYITYKNPVTSGYYKIWARNISPAGVLSTSSDLFYVEVINKASINIFGYEISYKILAIILAILTAILLSSFIMLLDIYERSKIPKPTVNLESVDLVQKTVKKAKKIKKIEKE